MGVGCRTGFDSRPNSWLKLQRTFIPEDFHCLAGVYCDDISEKIASENWTWFGEFDYLQSTFRPESDVTHEDFLFKYRMDFESV